MKVVIAPDSFKESLPATEVAEAIAQGVLEVCGDARIDRCPMADGGGGTVDAMVAATGGEIRSADVYGPLGEPIRAHWGLLGVPIGAGLPGELGLAAVPGDKSGGELTAVIEMAAAGGLHLIPPQRRDPMRATTFGVGQLILAALDAGSKHIIVGIGGSATVDGGVGCAQALGVEFLDIDGRPCVSGMGGGSLSSIAHVNIKRRDPRLNGVRISVACDVNNPLTGPHGAARVYGPQKGATPEMIEMLEAGLCHLAEVIRRDLYMEVESIPGGGAAGGLGAGLAAFAGAKLVRGVDVIAKAIGLAGRLRGADLCITGEGRLDSSSRFGKTAFGVALAAGAAGVPTVCLAGQVVAGAPTDVFAGVHALVKEGVSVELSIRNAREHIRLRTIDAVKQFLKI